MTSFDGAPTLALVGTTNKPAPAPEPHAAEQPAKTAATDPMLVCPNCGRTLTERKCKLLCPNPICGYYLSCSDYY